MEESITEFFIRDKLSLPSVDYSDQPKMFLLFTSECFKSLIDGEEQGQE